MTNYLLLLQNKNDPTYANQSRDITIKRIVIDTKNITKYRKFGISNNDVTISYCNGEVYDHSFKKYEGKGLNNEMRLQLLRSTFIE